MYNGSEDRVQYWQARSLNGTMLAFASGIYLLTSGGPLGRASGTATSHTSTWSSTWIYSPRYILCVPSILFLVYSLRYSEYFLRYLVILNNVSQII